MPRLHGTGRATATEHEVAPVETVGLIPRAVLPVRLQDDGLREPRPLANHAGCTVPEQARQREEMKSATG